MNSTRESKAPVQQVFDSLDQIVWNWEMFEGHSILLGNSALSGITLHKKVCFAGWGIEANLMFFFFFNSLCVVRKGVRWKMCI